MKVNARFIAASRSASVYFEPGHNGRGAEPQPVAITPAREQKST
jgi:hypothetical protein